MKQKTKKTEAAEQYGGLHPLVLKSNSILA